ncbi:MAG: methyltransferase domain-containing protein [Ktedonobacterales bacterium]|nr:methyltransferase domain-containing protein [Ktedonobacterales bacterium]
MDRAIDALGVTDASELKACCATAYQSEWARLILGDSFHPGGLALTERLGEWLALTPTHRVLDVAAGQGASALRLAERFGCTVVGVDYGSASVQAATLAAQAAGLDHLVTFQQGDAEQLPVADAAFDAVICECAFCTFPDKPTAAREFMRVLAPGGRVGLSDLTRTGAVPDDLSGLLAWIACIADAQPLAEYVRYLREAGFTVAQTEPHDAALAEMVRAIQGKLLGAEIMVKLKKIDVPPTVDFAQAKALAQSASAAIKSGTFGYALLTATKAHETPAD